MRFAAAAFCFSALMLMNSACGSGSNQAAVESYRYTAVAEGRGVPTPYSFAQDGIVDVAGDREFAHAVSIMANMRFEGETVRVGDARWIRGEIPYFDALGPANASAAPHAGQTLVNTLDETMGVPETVNGVAALRHQLTGAQVAALMAATAPLPAQAAPKPATVWIDQDLGVPVRFVMDSPDPSGTGTVHFEINVTQINVPVQITAPPGRALGRKPSSRQTEPTWSDYAKSLVDSILGVFTGVSPFDTKQAVDTVAEAAPSIQENRENAEEYFDAYPDAPDRDRYTMADEDLSNKTSLYKWFWGLFE